MATDSEITAEAIRRGIADAGLSGRPICVHSSLKSFGRIAGGAAAVVGAILDEGCTLVVPTFAYRFMTKSQPGLRPARNGCDYAGDKDRPPASGEKLVYSPDSAEISESMGKLPAAVLAVPGRVRGDHPICPFAAVGPLARAIIDEQKPNAVFGCLRKLAELDGACVLMGVGLNRLTLLHYAEQVAGRAVFRRWANGPDGEPTMVEIGGCSDGFDRLRPALAHVLKSITVGTSLWTYMDSRRASAAAAEAIRREAQITHCSNSNCERCRDMCAGGPLL